MTREEIETMAHGADDPTLAQDPGMVTQVWQDGEVTCQKCGDLLWQRTLHCFESAVPGAAALGLKFPHAHGKNSYAFVTADDARRIRAAIQAGRAGPAPGGGVVRATALLSLTLAACAVGAGPGPDAPGPVGPIPTGVSRPDAGVRETDGRVPTCLEAGCGPAQLPKSCVPGVLCSCHGEPCEP